MLLPQWSMVRLFAACLGIAAVVLLPFGLWESFLAWRSTGWPTVPATFSAFKSTSSHGGTKIRGGGSASISVAYDYEVDGVRYHGTRATFGWAGYIDKSSKSDLVGAFTAKATYPIAYAPGNPARSVVFPGWNPGGLIIVVAGLILGTIALGAFVGTRKRGDSGD